MGEGPKEACGLFGIFNHRYAPYFTYLGLTQVQHRGEEGFGISCHDGENWHKVREMGFVLDKLTKDHFFQNGNLPKLRGDKSIGHVRYSTTGDSNLANIQPIEEETPYGKIQIAHNGNLTNGITKRLQLEQEGNKFKTTTDTEVIGKLISRSGAENLEDALVDALQQLEGSYSLLVMSKDAMYAARDPLGNRPLKIGTREGSLVFTSETPAFDVIKAEYIRDINPGELIIADNKTIKNPPGYRSRQYAKEINPAPCTFEIVYFERPDNKLKKDYCVADARIQLGILLAKEHPVNADFVTPIPDSGNYAAIGFAQQSKIPRMDVYVRTHHSGRSFIKPSAELREEGIDIKLNAVSSLVKGKRIVVVDDTVVRGNTSRRRIELLWEAGAKEVHLRVSAPPVRHPCYYGIDFPTPGELIANRMENIDKIREYIKATTLGYLSIESFEGVMREIFPEGICTACWTNKYPTRLVDRDNGLIGKLNKTKC